MTTAQVRLDPMTAEEYEEFAAATVQEYADSKVAAGTWAPEESLAKAQEVFGRLLPKGIASPDSHLLTVRDARGGQAVARLWFALRGGPGRREAYVYEVTVAERFRGQGYGRATMTACVEKARELGVTSVGLHVLGGNGVARSLYTSLGFAEVGVMMSLSLGAS